MQPRERERELGRNENSGLAWCSLGLVGHLSVSNPHFGLKGLSAEPVYIRLWVANFESRY